MGKHLSSSEEQTRIESIVISKLIENGYDFSEKQDGNPNYKLDVFCQFEGKLVIGEIYAGIDKLQPAQKKKIVTDFFKLVYVEKLLKEQGSKMEIRKVMFFVDEKLENKFINDKDNSNSWVKDAIKSFGIELITETILEKDKDKLRKAKKGQGEGMKLTNPKK